MLHKSPKVYQFAFLYKINSKEVFVLKEQIAIYPEKEFLAEIDRFIEKSKPKFQNRSHFFIIAATSYLTKIKGELP